MISAEQIFNRTKERRETQGVGGIVVRYAAVLVVIGLLTVLVFWGSYNITLQQTHDATVVEVSSKQRTLRLSAELIARQIIGVTSEEHRVTLTDRLEIVLSELEETHNVLAYGKFMDRPALPFLPEVQAYMFGPKAYLDRSMREFIEQGHLLLISDSGESSKMVDAFNGMLESHSPEMDAALNGVVSAYKHAVENKVATLQAIQVAGLFFVLSALVFSALTVFRPMEKRIKEDFRNLDDACEALRGQMAETEMARAKYEELGAENVELAEELDAAKRQAELAEKTKSSFLANMSHELRTPLNAILGFGQILEYNPKEPLSKTQQASVSHILKGGKHLLKLINDILDLARIEAGKVELSIEDVRISDITEECLSLVKEMAADRSIEITAPNADKAGMPFRADLTRVNQVFLNLMSNAIKYNRQGGAVTVGYEEKPEGFGRISITDTGDGIPENRQSELFQAFSRLGAESSEIEGTGIGLVVCKELVDLMDGNIGFESEKDKGSTFWFELPLSTSPTIDPDAGGKNDTALAEGKLGDISGTMLYVEDNSSNLQLMEAIVSQIGGLDMVSAHTAELGIEIARKEQPDIIILDINLPGMDGYEALKKLQELDETKNIPVLALSAAATKSDIEKGMNVGFLRYLTKPIQVVEVTDVIRSTLEASGKVFTQ